MTHQLTKLEALVTAEDGVALGVPMSRLERGSIRLIRLGDLPETLGPITCARDEQDERVTLPDTRAGRAAIVQEGDVVLSGRGTTMRVAYVLSDLDGAAIDGNLVRVRCMPSRMNGFVLAAYLASPEGLHALQALSRSSTRMLSLKASDLLTLDVPVPAPEVQERLARFVTDAGEYEQLVRREIALRQELLQCAVAQVLGGVA